MRITFVISHIEQGGAERVLLLLANHLAGMGHDISIVTYRPPLHATKLAQGVGIDVIARRKSWLPYPLQRIRALRRYLLCKRPDVAIAFVAGTNVEFAIAAFGLGFTRIGAERSYPPRAGLSWPWEVGRRLCYGLLDGVVAQTEKGADWVRSNTLVGNNVAVIGNPFVPGSRHEPVRTTAPPDGPFVLGMGRLVPEKNFAALIRAFAQAGGAAAGWHLVILGDGPLRGQLEQTARELGIERRLILPGYQKDAERWFASASAFAMTSDFEGLPNALLEAVCTGLPSIAFDCDTGPAELIDNGENGFLIPPGDQAAFTAHLGTLMRDPAIRNRMGRSALARADRYDIAGIAEQWLVVAARFGKAAR